MKSPFKKIVYFFLGVHMAIIVYEIIYILNSELPSFLSSYDYSVEKSNSVYHAISNLCKVLVWFLIVYLVNLERSEKKNILKKFNILQISENTNIYDLIINYKAMIVVLLFYMSNSMYSFGIYKNIILPIFTYYLMYIGYLRIPYGQIIIGMLLPILDTFVFPPKDYNIYYQVVGNNILPNIISLFLKTNNYNLTVKYIASRDINLAVSKNGKKIVIYLVGDILNFFTKKELISALFHEIGHVIKNHFLFKIYIFFSIIFAGGLFEFLMIKNKNKILNEENEVIPGFGTQDYKQRTANNLICLSIILSMTISPLLLAFLNTCQNFHELEADEYSVLHYNKKYLIDGLIKISKEKKLYPDCSFLYDCIYNTHPCLIRRISNIENIAK